MNTRKAFFVAASILLFSAAVQAAPAQTYGQHPPSQRQMGGGDISTTLRQLRTDIADLKHEMRNHEDEIRIFDRRIQSQEGFYEDLKQQLLDETQTQRDLTKAATINLEGKSEIHTQSINNLEAAVKGLTSDLRQMKTQSNDSVSVLGQHRQKISELEELVHTQGQLIQNLELALKSVVEVWEAKETARELATQPFDTASSVNSDKTYKVQPGDSLEKIARTHKVSIQSLRAANQLTGDRILIGQTLKIP